MFELIPERKSKGTKANNKLINIFFKRNGLLFFEQKFI